MTVLVHHQFARDHRAGQWLVTATNNVWRRPEGGSALDTKFEIQTYVAKTSASAKGGKS
jgi:hypothetical protein